MAQIMMMTLMVGPEGKILEKHIGIRDAIRKNFDEGTPPAVAATHVAAALMSYAIEQDDDTVRKQIVEQLLAQWSVLGPAEQREISRQLTGGTLNQDMLLTRCQWLLIRGQDLLMEEKIELHDFRILKDSIYGPLKGEPSNTRMLDRVDEALDAAFGPRV
ncbi:hypothetical protein PSQ90_15000 [Devosia rhodophyticola]|uniref:TerB family tellurite resistance protein n=1 Tax=Devosia rhodophyticola TaxID=3026423 RepID=A0ABY7YW75_9HYPH|nr:hypothetical protein [Devosia rhodophyticola]WDR05564.1 hypothetical protein PSQ90_15000 [Devosia rhodophyticola]